MSSILNILEQLISKPSVTPLEAGAIDYTAKLLKDHNFTLYRKDFKIGTEVTSNLYATYGTQGKNLCFAGHVDVVPAGDISAWKYPPFEMQVDNELVFGRGAVDMKGAVACMVKALIDWAKDHNQGKVSILLTSDEEGSGLGGTKPMLEWLSQQNHLQEFMMDFTIVGEPTSLHQIGDTIKIGRRGSINFTLTVEGKQGHIAYPELAINPNRIIVQILNALNNLKVDEGNESFQPSNLEITSIDVGNQTTNLIPNKATAKFNIRYGTARSSEDIINNIKEIILNYTSNYQLDVRVSAEAFITTPNDFTENFMQIVEKVCNVKSILSTSGGTSDARFIKNYSPVLEFGLLNKTAHQANEHTEINHLQKLYDVYYEAIKCFHNKH